MDNKTIKGMIYGFQVVELCCFISRVLATTVQLKFSLRSMLSLGVNQVVPLGDRVNNTQHFWRVFIPSQILSHSIFFRVQPHLVSPGFALDTGHETTYYTYCAKQVPYRDVESMYINGGCLVAVGDAVVTCGVSAAGMGYGAYS